MFTLATPRINSEIEDAIKFVENVRYQTAQLRGWVTIDRVESIMKNARLFKIVLLPGMDGTGKLFDPLIEQCPSEFDSVVVPLPKTQCFTYPDLAEELISQLPSDEPFLLLGESFSGPLALEIACRQPKGLMGVILVASFIRSPRPRWLKWLPWRLLAKLPMPSFALRWLMTGWSADSSLVDLLRSVLRSVPTHTLSQRLQMIFSCDATRSLRDCPTHLLYLQASKDRLVPQSALKLIQKLRPDIQHHAIDGPHLLLQTHPNGCWNAIRAFQNSHCG